jgi:hypothetical protein
MSSEDQILERLLNKFSTFTWSWQDDHYKISVVAKCVKDARKKVLAVFDKIAEVESEINKSHHGSNQYIELTQELRESMPLDDQCETCFASYKPGTFVDIDDLKITLRDYIIHYNPSCKKGPVSMVRFL